MGSLGGSSSFDVVLAVAAALAVAVLLLFAIRLAARRIQIIRRIGFPLSLAAVAAGLKVFTLFETTRLEALDQTLSAVLIFLAAAVVLWVLGLLFFDVYLHSARGVRLPPLLPRVAMGLIYVIAGVLVIKLVFPGAAMGALVATSAVTSLVLGLALQPILGNFFAGVVIALERPFRINDWIKVGETEGRVVEITWRTTHLRTRDNDNLVIPNGSIANQEILNFYYPHPLHLSRIYVGVHYRTPPYRVKQAILDAVEAVPSVLQKPSPEVYLLSFDDSAITYEVRVWIEDIAHRPRIESHVKSEIWEKFRRRGITIPFPIRTIEFEPSARQLELTRPRQVSGREMGEPYAAKLYVSRGPDRGKSLALRGDEVKVGRSSSCELVLKEPRASKEHFKVSWFPEEGYVLEDLESRNGTMVNDRDVDKYVLHNFDRVSIGDSVMVFEIHGN